jgi:predicted nucleic acid-binding protein
VTLVDTSVWIDHLRAGDPGLAELLNADDVLMHPFVIGELALGRLPHPGILHDLLDLPKAPVADHGEVLVLIDQNALAGSGIGYVDAHLLAAVRLSPGSRLWTRDKRLLATAEKLGLAAQSLH